MMRRFMFGGLVGVMFHFNQAWAMRLRH